MSGCLQCTNCQTITKDLKPTPWGKPGFEEKPYVHKPVARKFPVITVHTLSNRKKHVTCRVTAD